MLKNFNETYLPLINLVLSLAGLASVYLLYVQYKKDNAWKKLQSSYNFIGIGEEFELQERLYKVFNRLGVYGFPEVCRPFTKEEVDLIRKDMEATIVTNMFLNHLQNLCTALSFHLVEKEVFDSIHSNRICWWHTILTPYIEQRKIDYKNTRIWKEFNDLALACYHENDFHFRN